MQGGYDHRDLDRIGHLVKGTSNLSDPSSHNNGNGLSRSGISHGLSHDVVEYQHRIKEVVSWLYDKESVLKERIQNSIDLDVASLNELIREYKWQEEFLRNLSEFSQTVMKCKVDGQEMRDNEDDYSEEDRDEIGIQIDTMIVCQEKMKIQATERLSNLQDIVQNRQQSKMIQFEDWLTNMEVRKASSKNIEPDLAAIRKQIVEVCQMSEELKKKQEFLNFISNIIIFDDMDAESLQVRQRSNETLDDSLVRMNRRWTDICNYVTERMSKLKRAESIWMLLEVESPHIVEWLQRVETRLQELSDGVKNLAGSQPDKAFITKLLSRSDKIESEIKSKQSLYTGLENTVRSEIEKFDDPCSMLVIELERKLEDMQDRWTTIVTRKRQLDYTIQALSNPNSDHAKWNMIPLPDPITSVSSSDLTFNHDPSGQLNGRATTLYVDQIHAPTSDNVTRSVEPNDSFPTKRFLNDDFSSDTKSLLYAINSEPPESSTNHLGSQDELSTNSLSVSYPLNVASIEDPSIASSLIQAPFRDSNLTEHSSDAFISPSSTMIINKYEDISHSCKVEEWNKSLESFSSWLKHVEGLLGITFDDKEHTRALNERDWKSLDLIRQLSILNEIEDRITTTYQDQFNCLALEGQEIVEDLLPEISDKSECRVNLEKILDDIEVRYATVKTSIAKRKLDIGNRDRWLKLIDNLQESCDYLLDQMGQVVPENNIGVDLITIAQQQDQLMHSKADLEDNNLVRSTIEESKLFLQLSDILQQQRPQLRNNLGIDIARSNKNDFDSSIMIPSNQDIWLSFRDLRSDIEGQLDRLTLHHSELSQIIEDRLTRLDDVHKEMHGLQQKMQEMATELQVAEIMRSNWISINNLSVEDLSQQLEDLKLFRERLGETEATHRVMNSVYEWMKEADVPVSKQNLKRLNELNSIWDSIDEAAEERQHQIEQAFDEQSSSEQKFLAQTVADLPNWERKVATSKVPYFVDNLFNKTTWNHPKFDDLLKSMTDVKEVMFAAYRTALKVRIVQQKLGIDLLMLEQLKEVLDQSSNLMSQAASNEKNPSENVKTTQTANGNDTLIGVNWIVLLLKSIYEKIQQGEKKPIDVPLCIDLCLNWLLNLYDSTRTGYVNLLSLKIGLALICCATREEKYTYIFELVCNQGSCVADARKLGALFETCMRIPIYLGEGESFGGADIIESSIKNCFSMAKYNPQQPNCIDLGDYLNWLKTEPQFIIWLPVVHRILISENTSHPHKCKLCRVNPIVGLRYRCLRCFKFNICQTCFLTGRHINEHHDPAKHPMREYCCPSGSGQSVKDFTKIIRNRLTPKNTSWVTSASNDTGQTPPLKTTTNWLTDAPVFPQPSTSDDKRVSAGY